MNTDQISTSRVKIRHHFHYEINKGINTCMRNIYDRRIISACHDVTCSIDFNRLILLF